MAEYARCQFQFRKIVFVPAFQPPHRLEDKTLEAFSHRYQMVKLACENNPSFEVSDIESHRSTPSYTFETLKALYTDLDSHQNLLPLIIGTDALQHLASWYQAEKLIDKVVFLQAPRENTDMLRHITIASQKVALKTTQIEMPLIGISSTEIRERLEKGKSTRYLTPDPVRDYIHQNHLYGCS